MQPGERIAFIVNPRSAHGRTGRRWPAFLRAIEAQFSGYAVFTTEYPEHGVALTQQALWDGFTRMVSVGGLESRPDVVQYTRGRILRIESSEAVKINTDGEVPGVLPATIELLPGAIQVVTGR